METDALKNEFVPKYLSSGNQKFYRFLIVYALNKLIAIEKKTYTGAPPDLELLDYSDKFIILYRREGDETYLKLARCFRKAAHKIYRIMLKKNMTTRNSKFLNLV
jgi:hypothetical protein